jgi:hypothetical protein
MSIKQTNLLIFRGLEPKDFNINYRESSARAPSEAPSQAIYMDMPKRFISVETWPTVSNLRCWSCDQMTTGYPKFIPLNLEKNANGDDTCDVYGHFHEWNCAARYIYKEFPREQRWDALEALCLIESKFSLCRREKIMPAPPKILMKPYCGNGGLTTKQYNDKIAALNAEYTLSTYKLEHFSKS